MLESQQPPNNRRRGMLFVARQLVVRRLRYHRRIAERYFTLPGAGPQAALPGPDQHGGSRPSETLIIAAVTHHPADPCSFYTKKASVTE